APPLEEMTRQRKLLRLGSVDDRLAGSTNRVDILGWLAATGVSADEQFAIGFGLAAMIQAFGDDAIKPRVLASHVDDLLVKLKLDHASRDLAVLSSTREQFRGRFTELGGGDAAFAWE